MNRTFYSVSKHKKSINLKKLHRLIDNAALPNGTSGGVYDFQDTRVNSNMSGAMYTDSFLKTPNQVIKNIENRSDVKVK